MAKQALATLESALRARKLDRTLTTALPPLERTDGASCVATDIAALDACLRSGVPRGQLSELVGPRSSGRMTLLLQLIAAATRRGDIAAFVDTFDRLDIASTVAAGVDLDRLLWIRGQAISKTETALDSRWVPGGASEAGGASRAGGAGGASGLLERTIDRALKACNLVLQAGGFGVVALDLADVPSAAIRRIPFTTWLRVQRTIEGSDTACVLVAPEPLARSAGGLTLSLSGQSRWIGDADRSRRLAGVAVHTRVVSPRRRVDGEVEFESAVHECGEPGLGIRGPGLEEPRTIESRV